MMVLEGEVPKVWITPPRTAARSTQAKLERQGWRRVGNRHAPFDERPRLDPWAHGNVVRVTVRSHWTATVSWFGFCRHHAPERTSTRFDDWLPTFLGGTSAAKPYGPRPSSRRPDELVLWEPWVEVGDRAMAAGGDVFEIVRFEDLVADPGFPLIRDPHTYQGLNVYTERSFELIREVFRTEIVELDYQRERLT